ncbi:BON domain-containing protein [Rhodanobacter sp. DHG33]|uniref:BON domain-containing protein n=1 Tax=Rhodanobacter sp. DHG33 TaxID=2775921 RepID=UPI001786A446|nr:BON domain-containing protein [Rhodanobacter sp. DHG33]MBD8898509.1 BON domain-containing protein [Rhodanobacter sp. DHG33]
MKAFRTMPILALAAALGAGMIANAAYAAPQASSSGDRSADTGQAASDTWITTKVKSELATTKGVKSMDVSVTTTNGVVTLTGVLATQTDVRKAVAAAKSVKGVRDVDASGLKSKD